MVGVSRFHTTQSSQVFKLLITQDVLKFIATDTPLILDGAHNPSGALALREYLDEFVKEPLTLVFGAMKDKGTGRDGGNPLPHRCEFDPDSTG